jgi:SAM-dependent methyltransferase
MIDPCTAKFIRYLSSKKSVDDRALNAHVAQAFLSALSGCNKGTPLRVLEVGAGIGTMIERLITWDAANDAVVTAVDEQAELLSEARRRLTRFGEDLGYDISTGEATALELRRGGHLIRIEFIACEVLEFARAYHHHPPTWDALLGHAFLDLVDVPRTLAALARLLHDGALLYLTLNFDGVTKLLPQIDPALDDEIEVQYHRTMDRRRRDGLPSGESHTGRRLFQALPAVGAHILEAGSSDWIVFPTESGYPDDERFFLEWIIDSIESALYECEEIRAEPLAKWIAQRRLQIERGELIYVTHQLDFLAQMAGHPPTM